MMCHLAHLLTMSQKDELSQEWQAQLFRDLPEDGVEIAGDGQCDSPGYSVKYCTYTVLVMEVREILYYEQIRVGEDQDLIGNSESDTHFKTVRKECTQRVNWVLDDPSAQ
ncbi:hypothetical protein MRX96_009009 [Rhipicephalus microplus]